MAKNKWTDDEIEILRGNWKNSTASQMALLIPRHSRDAINRKLKRIGIKLSEQDISWRMSYARSFVNRDTLCKSDQSLTLGNLSNPVIQTLMGSMLGDGCSNKQSKNICHYRLIENHSLKQKDYLFWKVNIFSDFVPKFYVRKNCASMVTKTHPIFSYLREQFYEPEAIQKSLIPIDLLSRLDLLGLMVWYLDDGHRKKYSLEIGAMGWELKGLVSLVKTLNEKFDLSMYVYTCRHKNGGQNKIVKIPAKDRAIVDKWMALAKVHKLPKNMWYKLQSF